MKSEWGKWRRQIRPKIGQLTNDDSAIERIVSPPTLSFPHKTNHPKPISPQSQQLLAIIHPPSGPHHPHIYLCILSSLAKDILLQAEIETTAEKHSALPLARVTFNILSTVSDFSEIFFAKLVQRVGGWPIPIGLPSKDFDGREWQGRDEKLKILGFRKTGENESYESEADFTARVAGSMRIYFSVLKIVPTRGPLKTSFQLPRYWTWFARMLGERALLESAVAAQVMYSKCFSSFSW